MSELLENNLYFNTGTIPEITKNGKIYRFTWRSEATPTFTIMLDSRFLLPTTGNALEDYAYIDGTATSIVFSTVLPHIVSGIQASTFGLSQKIFIAAPSLANFTLDQWGDTNGIVGILGVGNKTVTAYTTPNDYSDTDYFPTLGVNQGTSPIGTIYDMRCRFPNNFHLRGYGKGTPHFTTGGNPIDIDCKVKLSFPEIVIASSRGESLYTGSAVINSMVPRMTITFTNAEPNNSNYGEPSIDEAIYWAEFYMGDV